jgi:hypothetical protein
MPDLPLIKKEFLGYSTYKLNYLTKTKVKDFIFFLIAIALPTSFFGLVNDNVFYIKGYMDLEFLSFILVLPYMFLYFKNAKKIKKLPGIKVFYLLVLYIFIRFLLTILMGQGFKETFTIFRKFFSPIYTLAMILYLNNFNRNRIVRFFRWLTIAMIIQSIFFTIYYLTGFNVFGVEVYQKFYIGGQLVQRYFKALPKFSYLIYPILFIEYLFTKKTKFLFGFIIVSLPLFLVATRSVVITYLFSIVLIFFLYSGLNPLRIFKNSFLISIASILTVIVLLYFYRNQLNFLLSRLTEIRLEGLENVGNYAFRLSFIGQSYNEIKSSIFSLLFGNGYERVAAVGNYDYVLGGDTHIPGIIYCEGLFGFLIRFIPFIILMIYAIKKIDNRLVAIVIITFVLRGIINIVQTPMIRYYDYLFPYVILLINYSKFNDKGFYDKTS